jgi:hypothetical protein
MYFFGVHHWANDQFRKAMRAGFRRLGMHLRPLSPAEDIHAVIDLLRPRATAQGLIRIGGTGDGGYLVPDDLDGIGACFSPGVSRIANFELELANTRAIPSFLADYSVDAPPQAHPLLEFDKRFLGSSTDETHIRLQDWVTAKDPERRLGDLLLQMDIEDGEYCVLTDTPHEVLNRFRIIVVELHGLGRLADPGFLRLFRPILRKLTANHVPVHLHPNNFCTSIKVRGIEIPPVLEVTLLRRDRFRPDSARLSFPHHLDENNSHRKKDLHLPREWQ